jgi:hypothetical protein
MESTDEKPLSTNIVQERSALPAAQGLSEDLAGVSPIPANPISPDEVAEDPVTPVPLLTAPVSVPLMGADSACLSLPISEQPVASGDSGLMISGSLRHEIRVWTRDLLIAIGLALVIIVFLYQPVKVEGTSMAPLLSDQERIFINKFVYRFEPIERGDENVFCYALERC